MGKSAGIYPMYMDQVKWGCSDIDNGSWEDAHNLFLILERMELNPVIELSRSKGYHVWVFCQSWVPAWVMRRAFLFAHHVTTQLDMRPIPPTEVNPKAEWLEPGQLGNFVRLPYVRGQADENGRRTMVNDLCIPISLELFLSNAKPVSEYKLRQWADKYQPPKRRLSEWSESSAEAKELAQRLTGKGFVIWRDGPPDWDPRRSNAMARLALECARSGLDKGQAHVLISDLDERLQKWTNRNAEATEAARRSCVEWGYANA
jgi:hypothetical protein